MATMQDVANMARVELNDDDKDRYSDGLLLSHANSYVQESIKLRPDLHFRNALNPPSATLALTDDFPLSDRYLRSCADYIIGRAKMRDTEEGSLTEAAAFLQLSTAQGGK